MYVYHHSIDRFVTMPRVLHVAMCLISSSPQTSKQNILCCLYIATMHVCTTILSSLTVPMSVVPFPNSGS